MKQKLLTIVFIVLCGALIFLVLTTGGIISTYGKQEMLSPTYKGGIIIDISYRGVVMDKQYIIKHNNKIYKVRPYNIDEYNVGDTIK